MCQCATAVGSGVGCRFWQDDVNLGLRFDGGQISSDGGLPWVVQAEMALGRAVQARLWAVAGQ
jgi:hypothetical protein